MSQTQTPPEPTRLDFLMAVDRLIRAAEEARLLRDRLLRASTTGGTADAN